MHLHKPKSLLDALVMEKNMYEVALTEWNTMEPSGTAFSPQMQKDVSWTLVTESFRNFGSLYKVSLLAFIKFFFGMNHFWSFMSVILSLFGLYVVGCHEVQCHIKRSEVIFYWSILLTNQPSCLSPFPCTFAAVFWSVCGGPAVHLWDRGTVRQRGCGGPGGAGSGQTEEQDDHDTHRTCYGGRQWFMGPICLYKPSMHD